MSNDHLDPDRLIDFHRRARHARATYIAALVKRGALGVMALFMTRRPADRLSRPPARPVPSRPRC